MAFEDYDVKLAFARIEDELIDSMMRNLGRHLQEEKDEGFDWSQWQVEQLKYLEEYRRKNKKKFGPQFADINQRMQEVIQEAMEQGQKDEELRILLDLAGNKKIQRRYANQRKASIEAQGDAFFRVNDNKLEALMTATQTDMEKAEQAVLRRANDQYRKIIFDAQVYANTGAATIEKAVDMATKDFLSRGIDSIQYKNGSRHTIKDYADMYIRTAERRAYLMGEGNKRKEWGMSLVLVNKRGSMRDGNYGTACPQCIPWLGKVLVDDVYSGGKPDGQHQLLSEAMAAGFLHPRCRDGFTTYFPGISSTPGPDATRKELKTAVEAEKEENREDYVERQEDRFERLAQNSLDPENQKRYEARRKEWRERQIGRTEENEKARIAMINQEGTDSLLEAYDRRREQYDLNLVPADQLKGNPLNNVKVDYTGVSVETAEAFNTTISDLSDEYLSGITQVRVADPKEAFGSSFFAQTQHNDEIGQKVLVINPHKCKDSKKMIERIRELSDKRHCVLIPEGMEAQYVATHEFAHGLLSTQETRKSLIGMDWSGTNRTRKKIKAMYQEYMDEIRSIESEINELKKSPILSDFNADPAEQMEAFKKLKEAQERLDSVRISKYSMENADEFMAEAFTQNRIGVSRSKYSDRVMEVLDREYRVDIALQKQGEKIDEARRSAISFISRKQVVEFDGLNDRLKSDFLDGLGKAPIKIKEVLSRVYKTVDYFRGDDDDAYYCYLFFEKYIYAGDQISADTLAHELFHRIDHKDRISKRLSSALQKDYKTLKILSSGNSSIKEYLMITYPNAFEYKALKGQYVLKPQYCGIADILNGLSGGKVYYGYGHPRDYWKKKGNLESEGWAQFGRIQFVNDPDVIKLFSNLFPNLENKAFIELDGLF